MIIAPKVRSVLFEQLARNNPCYLISAACMLGGCLALTNSLSWTSIPTGRLLTLIATLNVYEFALIGLAVFLINRRNLRRDGVILLVLEAFFLVDITFLNAEIGTANIGLGIAINAMLFVLAAIKLRLVARAIGASLPAHRFAFVMTQIAALLAIPIVMRWMDHGSLSPRNFYAAWWIAGLMPVVGDVLSRLMPAPAQRGDHFFGAAMVYVALPWLSLIAHLGILHYVYTVNFYGADIAPLLIGLAIIMHRASPSVAAGRTDLLLLRIILPAAAVFVSLNNPAALCFVLDKSARLAVNPTRLATAAAYLTYVYLFLAPYALFFVSVGAAAMLAMLFGPSAGQMNHAAANTWDKTSQAWWKIVPRTTAQWGMVAVVAAFGFLALGASISLRASKGAVKELLPPPQA